MKYLIVIMAVVLSTLLLSGCSSKDPVQPKNGSNPPTPTCIAFADQTSGTQFNVGSPITDNGVNIQVEQFQWSNGTWYSGGYSRITDQVYAGGSGLDVNCNNVNLNFGFTYPGTRITLKFGDYGGNENITVNGTFQNVTALLGLNGTQIGGVNVTVTATTGSMAVMTLEGTINSFTIGGQELWLDDICFTPSSN